jgi:putative membrane protein
MRHSLLLSLLFIGSLASVQAQNPAQTAPMSQSPGGTPRATNPMDRSGYPQDRNRDDQRMENKIDEKKFVKDALLGGMTEVELGKVAVEKASSDAVKQFGQKMIDDHSKANEELKQIASKENINAPDSLDSKHQSRVDKLSKLSGPDFDRAYIKDQLKDHQQDVKEFQLEAKSGSDPEVKSFASKTLPILEEHLSMVKELDKGKKTTALK